MVFILTNIFKILGIIIPLLVSVAYFTIIERKIMGSIQRRKGPNVIGFIGLLQPLADGLKLFVKETTLPTTSNTGVFLSAPMSFFILSLLSWAAIPFSDGIVLCDINLSVFYLFAVSSLSVYGILFSGWSSNSKYSYLGSIRSAAQMISYEISIGFSILNVIICTGSFNLSNIILAQSKTWFALPCLPILLIFSISMLSETNRHPFDLPEADAELVSGYNVEYSAMAFAFFFLGEYANMLLMSAFLASLFLGGWLPLINNFLFHLAPSLIWLSIKIIIGVVFFIFTRACLPRYRYDQLMDLGWKCFLPQTLGYFLLIIGYFISFNWLSF